MSDAVLAVTGLSAGYAASAPIVRDFSLSLRAGEIVALVGSNGAGKSTAVKAVAGVLRPFGGRIVCAGADLTGADAWTVARAGLGYVPQRRNVFAELTVRENLAIGLRARAGRDGPDFGSVLALFPDLASRQGSRAGHLSGGMRQMVAIGRALLGAPRVLLLDEPAAGLSPVVAGRLFNTLAELKRRIPVLLVEQNIRGALAVADRCLVMAEGRLGREVLPDEGAVSEILAGVFAT
jgi:ABC-type branched-subunit amino acid transport system ATPase component